MEFFLEMLVSLMSLSLAVGAPTEECCATKVVGGVTYSFVQQLPSAVPAACLSNCVYQVQGGDGVQYCFGVGDMEVHCGNVTDSPTGGGGGVCAQVICCGSDGVTYPTPCDAPEGVTCVSNNPCSSGTPSPNPGGPGGDSTITIRQTWGQEPAGYDRTAEVRVPASSAGQTFPVVVDLHGNGGQGNLQRLGRTLGDNVVLVAPNGYERSWNIIKEASKAPDVDFILELIRVVGETLPEANMGEVTIVGTSNGAGMINRLLIESPGPLPFHRVIPMVSTMIENQHHDSSFWKRSDEATESYDLPASPATPGPQFVHLHGTDDGAVPYEGGRGVLGLQFLGAQDATYTWASYWGETAAQLGDSEGSTQPSGFVKYSYLGGRVIHYKVPGAGHSLGGEDVDNIVRDLVLGE